MGVRDEIARNGAPHARRSFPLTASQRNVGEQRGQIRKRVHAAKANGPPQTPTPRTTNTPTSSSTSDRIHRSDGGVMWIPQ